MYNNASSLLNIVTPDSVVHAAQKISNS